MSFLYFIRLIFILRQLLKSRPDAADRLSTINLIKWAQQIAKGMEYLSFKGVKDLFYDRLWWFAKNNFGFRLSMPI